MSARKPATRLYIIATDEYMGAGQKMYSFRGTWRALLEDLLDVDEEVDDGDNEPGWRSMKTMTDEELVALFDDANGDGQQYVMVFDVKADRKVLG